MHVPDAVSPAPKSLVLAFVLWFFLGGLGMHRFYLCRRRAWTILVLMIAGVVLSAAGFRIASPAGLGISSLTALQDLVTIARVGLLLLGVVGVWLLVDLFFIAKWVGEHNARGGLHSPR